MAAMDEPRLPTEVILLIVEAVLPANPEAIVPPSHSSVRTLLSLARVSRATYEAASRLLRRRCMHLESSRRLADVLLCMPRLVPTLPPIPSLRHMTTLYLKPFGASLDDLPTAMWVRELLCETGGTLRRLVVDMPFGSLHVLDDYLNVKKQLRQGFEQLQHLEEFVCLGDYPSLSLAGGETDVWRLWPELRRLTLFQAPLDNHWLWWDIATLPRLSHVVLARPASARGANVKEQYFAKLPRGDARLDRRITVVLVDDAARQGHGELATARWREVDPAGRMTVAVYGVPRACRADGTPGGLEVVTEWARRRALDGSLWQWVGEEVQASE
ncbi:hypothetical protein S40293_09960 [Stachybotrys chartarum IBT 40293]|nr:hypothetical protein S40293_09960 [Stachybotrys chartarum IBT 40293]